MKLVPIFVKNRSSFEGLHAVTFDEVTDEFDKIFELWSNTNYIQNYLIENRDNLNSGYYNFSSIDNVIDDILDQAESLEKLILQYAEEGFNKNGDNLQTLFKPLDNREYTLPPHQETKAKPRHYANTILRVYAIRISPNTFVFTGGLIKLTNRMDECPYGKKELEKLKQVKSFLRESGIEIEEDLDTYYYYEQ